MMLLLDYLYLVHKSVTRPLGLLVIDFSNVVIQFQGSLLSDLYAGYLKRKCIYTRVCLKIVVYTL